MEKVLNLELKDNMKIGLVCQKCGSNVRYKKSGKCVPCKTKSSRLWYKEKSKDKKWVEKENKRKRKWAAENWELARRLTDEWERRNRKHVNKKARERRASNVEKHRSKEARWRRDNPRKIKNYMLKSNYGITIEDYERILQKQNGVCAICKCPDEYRDVLSVDHCHKTGEVRGLLCNLCNTGLGRFEDNPALLASALKYLLRENQDEKPQ